jgi:hypothetical protein
MITDKLKQTLSHAGKWTTLSLAVTMAEKAIRILAEYGISTRTISFFAEGLNKLEAELMEGYQFLKDKEDFEKIIKPLDKDNNADK